MPRHSNLGPLLIILIFLLALVGGYAIRVDRWPGLPWSLGLAPTKFTLQAEAPKGQLISGFPEDLVSMTKDTRIEQSAMYFLAEEMGKSEVLTTTYKTKASISELFAAYVEKLTLEGYTMTRTKSGSGESEIEAFNSIYSISINISVSSRLEKEVRVDVRKAVVQ